MAFSLSRVTRLRFLRTFILPLVFASAAFTYALGTSGPSPSTGQADAGSRGGAQLRSVGSPLRFTTPFLLAGTDTLFPTGGNTPSDPQGFDLGDALQNQPIRRVITAAGGAQPYSYTLGPNLDPPRLGTVVLPSITPIGVITGNVSVAAGTAANAFVRFNIVLTDFLATQRTGIFYLRMFNSPIQFRFAQDRLPLAQQGIHYYADLETVGGVPPITYRVVPGVSSNSTNPVLPAGAVLEDAGLSLSPDGIVYGRPIVNGTLNFSITATDATGATATSRAGTGGFQPFALTVETNAQARSELVTLACSIKGNQVTPGKDSFTYSGLLDTRAETPASLAGSPFVLRIGTTSVSGSFNAKGKVNTTLPGNLKLSASLNGSRLKIKLTNAALTSALRATGLSGKQTLNTLIGLELVSFRTSDFLKFASVAHAGKYSLRYGLGTVGVPMAGAFQVISVHGADGKSGNSINLDLSSARATTPKTPKTPKVPTGPKTPTPPPLPDADSWDVTFIAVPRIGIDGGSNGKAILTGASSATIRIGTTFSQQLTLTQKPVQLEFRATGKDPGVFRLDLNPKTFVHRLQTNFISEDDTGIPPAIVTKDLNVFPLGLDFSGYSGESAKTMAPNRTEWAQR
jgi:hypothetical protein